MPVIRNRKCGCMSGCCGDAVNTRDCEKGQDYNEAPETGTDRENDAGEQRTINIDFLYLDREVCGRCARTDRVLDEAIAAVKHILEATDVRVVVNKIRVDSEELARAYRFVSSPTLRVNGRDIQMKVRETLCESCGDLCGDEVNCRVWVYRGKEYETPPKAMVIEAILRAVYGSEDAQVSESNEYVLPENLKRFYQGMKRKIGK